MCVDTGVNGGGECEKKRKVEVWVGGEKSAHVCQGRGSERESGQECDACVPVEACSLRAGA